MFINLITQTHNDVFQIMFLSNTKPSTKLGVDFMFPRQEVQICAHAEGGVRTLDPLLSPPST